MGSTGVCETIRWSIIHAYSHLWESAVVTFSHLLCFASNTWNNQGVRYGRQEVGILCLASVSESGRNTENTCLLSTPNQRIIYRILHHLSIGHVSFIHHYMVIVTVFRRFTFALSLPLISINYFHSFHSFLFIFSLPLLLAFRFYWLQKYIFSFLSFWSHQQPFSCTTNVDHQEIYPDFC